MPVKIKLPLSLLVLLVGAGAYYFETGAGNEMAGKIAGGLSVLMVAAMWVFPETGGRKGAE
ncbi:MAG: hypothetical protein HOL85_03910 [Rhodospirillaceae bacterium]|jgi:hypothetical protein|nr:hypothetical protein [Rhodospirillaceae bacterium]MBT6136611.1 hypothetical protein [Rhodospirillaceae bacterium]